METLDEQLDAANARLTEQTEQLRALEAENTALQAANDELKEKIDQMAKEIET